MWERSSMCKHRVKVSGVWNFEGKMVKNLFLFPISVRLLRPDTSSYPLSLSSSFVIRRSSSSSSCESSSLLSQNSFPLYYSTFPARGSEKSSPSLSLLKFLPLKTCQINGHGVSAVITWAHFLRWWTVHSLISYSLPFFPVLYFIPSSHILFFCLKNLTIFFTAVHDVLWSVNVITCEKRKLWRGKKPGSI